MNRPWRAVDPSVPFDLDAVRRGVERVVVESRRIVAPRRALPLALEAHVSRYCVGLARRDYHVKRLVE